MIPAYRGQRSLPGWWWSATTGGHVVFESWVERHHIMEFDRKPAVTGISGQPFAVVWTEGTKRRSHVPDLFVRYGDGRAAVVDCRPADRADEEFYRVAAVTAGVCERIGWNYLLAGEPEPVRAANLRWLAGYRRPYVRVGGVAEGLLAAVSPAATADRPRGVGGRSDRGVADAVPPFVDGRLEGDLGRPLRDDTVVSRADA